MMCCSGRCGIVVAAAAPLRRDREPVDELVDPGRPERRAGSAL